MSDRINESSMMTIEEAEIRLRGLLVGDFASLTITLNEHKSSYCTMAEYEEATFYDRDDWVSDEERTKAIETDSVWCIQWYPHTPIGSHRVLASSLMACIKEATSERVSSRKC